MAEGLLWLIGAAIVISALAFAEIRGLLSVTVVPRGKVRGWEAINKYFLPILWSNSALQARLRWLCDKEGYIERVCSENENHKEDAVTYTCYLFGEYIAWRHLYTRAVEYVGPGIYEKNGRPKPGLGRFLVDGPFDILPPFQSLIGEMMIISDGAERERRPMDYSRFLTKLAGDKEFDRAFAPIRTGLQLLAEAKLRGEEPPNQQLRLFQHALLQSLQQADPMCRTITNQTRIYCKPAESCECGSPICKKALSSKNLNSDNMMEVPTLSPEI